MQIAKSTLEVLFMGCISSWMHLTSVTIMPLVLQTARMFEDSRTCLTATASCPNMRTCHETWPVTRIHERTSQHSCTASYNTEVWWQRCGEKTHRPRKDPSPTCKANHTQRHWRDAKNSSQTTSWDGLPFPAQRMEADSETVESSLTHCHSPLSREIGSFNPQQAH